MKKVICLMSLSLTMIFIATSNGFSQKCTKESAETFEPGFYKLKYCLINLGWRESVKKYEWAVRVYNMYEDMNVKIEFTLIENGAAAKGYGSYTISANGGYEGYSYYFTSEPEFIYKNIQLIDK